MGMGSLFVMGVLFVIVGIPLGLFLLWFLYVVKNTGEASARAKMERARRRRLR
ncbi:MAG: hypothetical protein KAT35_05480 [Candidatus Aenigmarchaeota archaeon]|nr:hypothetical protein [Candidatus Aenigmarchaeota archaeon]